MYSWVRPGLYGLPFGLLVVLSCQKTAPGPVAAAPVSGSASSASAVAGADGGASVRRPLASSDAAVRTFNGMTWISGERVDADVHKYDEKYVRSPGDPTAAEAAI
jgi:hypothetical protein